MFPGPNARIYRNEAGEPLGWDLPSEDEGMPNEDEMERRFQMMRCEGCGHHPEDCECDEADS